MYLCRGIPLVIKRLYIQIHLGEITRRMFKESDILQALFSLNCFGSVLVTLMDAFRMRALHTAGKKGKFQYQLTLVPDGYNALYQKCRRCEIIYNINVTSHWIWFSFSPALNIKHYHLPSSTLEAFTLFRLFLPSIMLAHSS